MQVNSCRVLLHLVQIMKLSMDEELVANSLKIIRNTIKQESNHSIVNR